MTDMIERVARTIAIERGKKEAGWDESDWPACLGEAKALIELVESARVPILRSPHDHWRALVATNMT